MSFCTLTKIWLRKKQNPLSIKTDGEKNSTGIKLIFISNLRNPLFFRYNSGTELGYPFLSQPYLRKRAQNQGPVLHSIYIKLNNCGQLNFSQQ